MNPLPPGQERHDEVDELYRRASERDPSRPSEATRRAVLAHAERLAAARLTAPPRRPRGARWWPAAFGTLAAGILAALLVVPSQLGPGVPPPARKPASAGELAANAARAPRAPAEPAPADKLASGPDSERRAAGVPAAPPRSAPALALREAEHPGARSRFAPEPAAPAAEKRAGSLMDVTPTQADTSSQSVAVTGAPAAAARAAAGAAGRDSQPEEAADALHRGAAAGDVAVLDGLLAQPTDVNARDAAGRTALLVAVLHGRGAAIAMLLAHGADPNAADSAGTTPLAAARARGDVATAEILRRHGAR